MAPLGQAIKSQLADDTPKNHAVINEVNVKAKEMMRKINLIKNDKKLSKDPLSKKEGIQLV